MIFKEYFTQIIADKYRRWEQKNYNSTKEKKGVNLHKSLFEKIN